MVIQCRCFTDIITITLNLTLTEDIEMKIPNQSAGVVRQGQYVPRDRSSIYPAATTAAIQVPGGYYAVNDDGSWYYCEPRFSDGFYDCRSLTPGMGTFPPPPNPCVPERTETTCVLTTMWCKDFCRYPDGREDSGDWYFCGVCIPNFSLSSSRASNGMAPLTGKMA